jgi:hypothetical protein
MDRISSKFKEKGMKIAAIKTDMLKRLSKRNTLIFIGLLAGLVLFPVLRTPALAQPGDGTKRFWYNGDRKEYVWMADDEIALIHKRHVSRENLQGAENALRRFIPQATAQKFSKLVTLYKLPQAETSETFRFLWRELHGQPGVQYMSRVMYRGERRDDTRMAMTGEIIIHFRTSQTEEELKNFEDRFGVKMVRSFGFSPNTYLFDAREVDDCLGVANEIFSSGTVKYAYPSWLRTYSLR